ncbi:MAG: MBL fold metallo-hydrolase [Clostridia bacterium]|nr:MBL fold metallo-hydrolase [Clostridia bacterium]
MVELCSLFSGSSGNAALVRAGCANILIDCGSSGSQIEAALRAVGCDPSELSFIFVTHEHIDHIKGVGVMSRRYDLPVYATRGTWQNMISKIGAIKESNIFYIQGGVPFAAKDAVVTPFSTPHDARESVGFTIEHNNSRASVATDLGVMNKTVYESIKHSDTVLLESNHDVEMLMNGPYSYDLKMRIRSSVGHLSNVDSARTCAHLLQEGVKHILLGHLSHDNNLPDKAYDESASALTAQGAHVGSDVTLEVAPRFTPSQIYIE